jgi:alkyl hydroperoxide reductase subunit AhpF
MPFMSPRDREYLTQKFADELKGEVHLLLFTQRVSPLYIPGQETQLQDYGRQARELLEELVALSPLLKLEVHDVGEAKELASVYGIERTPALVLRNGHVAGRVRFFGVPLGYEFATLVADLIDLSRGETQLSEAAQREIAAFGEPVHILVFTTPT